MKKLLSLLLLLIPLFVMGNSSYQDEDYGLVYVDPVTMGLSADSTKHLAGGTLIGSITSMDVFIACPDDFYSWGFLGQDIFYYPYYYFNGRGVSVENGIFGQTNPKDKNNKSPSNSLTVPETGCAFSMKANKDGYMYVWGVFSTAKAYSLFEDSIAVGYRIAMITNGWHREGYNSILDHDRVYLQYGEWHKPLTRRTPDISYMITGDSLNQVNVYGEGVMVFPVRAGSTYIMLGSGCKFMFGGVHFSEEMESTIQLGDASAPTFTLLSKNDTPEFYEEAASPEPYAVLSDNNTKLTFFYDTEKETRGGMGVGPFNVDNQRGWHETRENITIVQFDESFSNCTSITSTAFWFSAFTKLTSIIGMGRLNTANVTNMDLMFQSCFNLTNIDVSSFETDNVKKMFGMFNGCTSLTSLDVSNFKTDNVTDMSWMFASCSNLTSLDVSRFKTDNVTSMQSMFLYCSNLRSIDVTNFTTDKVKYMDSMFFHCSGLTSLNLSNFSTQSVTNIDKIFAECTSLASIQAGNASIPAEEYAQVNNPNLLVYVNEARLAPSNVQNVVINGLAREIVLTDAQDGNNDWYAPQAFVAERISYTRNFAQSTTKGTSRGWESIALPFDVQTIQHESKGVIAPFNNSASNKHFWLRRLTDNGLQAATNIEANTPYIISMPNSEEYTADYNLNGRVTFSAQNIDVPATTTKVLALADSSIVMVPAMQRQSRSSSVWALNVGEVRGQYFEGSVFERDYRTVHPFEAYTIHRQENGQPAPRYVPIQEIAGVTGIETIDREPLTLNQWYDMQGRKLEGKPARKGVYISNGKKVVVK